MLISWLFLLVSWTCVMPMPAQIQAADTMPAACSESTHHPDRTEHFSAQIQDCSLKSCPDSQPGSAFNFKIDKPQIPLFILCLIWLTGCLFNSRPVLRIPGRIRPPTAKPVPLIYRFCTLLN